VAPDEIKHDSRLTLDSDHKLRNIEVIQTTEKFKWTLELASLEFVCFVTTGGILLCYVLFKMLSRKLILHYDDQPLRSFTSLPKYMFSGHFISKRKIKNYKGLKAN
jgi:hypothetical protein